jgi:S1-C subfamily serine protease
VALSRPLVAILTVSVVIGCSTEPASSPQAVDTVAADAGAVDAVEQSAVALQVQRCRPIPEVGAGLIIEPGRVLTAAHVVAGATTISLISGGKQVVGEVIGFDPIQDLAVIGVPMDFGPSIPLPSPAPGSLTGARGQIGVFRDGVVEVRDATIVRRVVITTEDIYRSGRHRRMGYEIDAPIEVGDSGAVVVVDGEAVAVVWARARDDVSRVWAADPVRSGALITAQLETGAFDDSVDLTRCS